VKSGDSQRLALFKAARRHGAVVGAGFSWPHGRKEWRGVPGQCGGGGPQTWVVHGQEGPVEKRSMRGRSR
jgi:hypothetical protein